MFCGIDSIIFPDSCEVVEIVPSQLYAFPVFKNGSSSLLDRSNNWKVIQASALTNTQSPIVVFLRSPRERFISGVNTYVQRTIQQHPELDEKTILWFVDQYLFLNRHFCPQFFWLLNLARFTGPDVKLKLCDVGDIKNFTPMRIKPPMVEDHKFQDSIDKFNWQQLELYMFLDQILTDRIGQELSLTEIFAIIKAQHPELYRLVFDKTIQLSNVLPKT